MNQSFLDMQKYLQEKGIKNNDFFLKLYDEDLKDIDIYDPNLTNEFKKKIFVEIQRNYWFFLRNIKISKYSDDKYVLNPLTLAMNWLMINNIDFFAESPRQTLRVTTPLIFYTWILLFGSINACAFISSKDVSYARDNLLRIRDLCDNLPEFLTFKLWRQQDALFNNFLNNQVRVKSLPKTKYKINDDVNFRLDSPLVFLDEFASIPNNELIILSQLPIFHFTKFNSIAQGDYHGLILCTSPAKEKSNIINQLQNNSQFDISWYDFNDEMLQKLEESMEIYYLKFTYKDIGLDNKYLKRMIQMLVVNNDWSIFRREVLLEYSDDPTCPFSEKELKEIMNN